MAAVYGRPPWWPSSRMYVKIHHASDVVAGVATGLAIGRDRSEAVAEIRNVPVRDVLQDT